MDSANVEYIKMDMNRSICDVYTSLAESGNASGRPERICDGVRNPAYQNYAKVMHGYVLGVYDFLERLIKRYPGAATIRMPSSGSGSSMEPPSAIPFPR